jgi:hypothetical protein
MERYCGTLQRSIQSRRFPFASLDRFVTETAQLSQIANLYDIADVLALRARSSDSRVFSDPQCMFRLFIQSRIENSRLFSKDPSCVLMPPKSQAKPVENLIAAIAGALATRFDTNVAVVKRSLQNVEIEQWAKVRRVDSDAGDIMHASSMVASRDDTRDATYVRVRSIFTCTLPGD